MKKCSIFLNFIILKLVHSGSDYFDDRFDENKNCKQEDLINKLRAWLVVGNGDLQRLTAFQTWYFPVATVTFFLDQLLIIMNNGVDKLLLI